MYCSRKYRGGLLYKSEVVILYMLKVLSKSCLYNLTDANHDIIHWEYKVTNTYYITIYCYAV